jgi:hypothetical protein
MNIAFDPVDKLLEQLRQGRIVIVTGDANRLLRSRAAVLAKGSI